MTQPVCRVGDAIVGVCFGHDGPISVTGVWVSGSGQLSDENKPVIRVGDTGIASCGHTFEAISGSSTTTDENKPVHRVSDAIKLSPGGTGVSVTGSPKWSSE